MTQVICPGCAKLIEVGVLPEGTLPSCPFCRTVFQLPDPAAASPSPGTAARDVGPTSENPQPRQRSSPAAEAAANRPTPAGDAKPGHKGGAGLVIALLMGCLVAMVVLLALSVLAHREKQHDA